MAPNRLVCVGGGGHCKSVIDSALRSGSFSDIVITDPVIDPGSNILGVPVVGNDNILPQLFADGYDNAFITVGSIESCALRIKLVKICTEIGYTFPVIADPSAQISESSFIGSGTFVGKNTVVNSDSIIRNHCIINTGAIIEHECSVGDYTHISVGSIICGNCSIGRGSFIGAGTTVIQGVNVGDNVVIGANSTLLANMENSMKAYGIIRGQYE